MVSSNNVKRGFFSKNIDTGIYNSFKEIIFIIKIIEKEMGKYTVFFALLFGILISSTAFAQEDETIKFYNSYVETTKKAKSIKCVEFA